MIRWMFRRRRRRRAWSDEVAAVRPSTVAEVRAAYARYPADGGIAAW